MALPGRGGLRSVRRREQAEIERHEERMRALRVEARELLIRSRAGYGTAPRLSAPRWSYGIVSVDAMADALGVSRQKVYRLLKEGVAALHEAAVLVREMTNEGRTDEEMIEALRERFVTRERAEAVLRYGKNGFGPLARPWRTWTEEESDA